MKKLLVLLLAFALLACTFAACGEEEKKTDAPTSAPTEASQAPTEASQAPTEASEAPSEASEAPSEASQAPSEAPTDASEAPTDASEAPTDASEAPTDASEAPTDASEAPTDASEAPTDASEAPTDASEAPTTPPADDGDVSLDDYENPVLFHTPVLDGVLDDEYLLSYQFDNPQYSELYVFDDDGNGVYDAWTNRSKAYVLWDGEYVYVAVELFDDDMLERSKAYTEWADEQGDVNPYYNDCAEVWYCFELMEPASDTDVRKICYDAYGVGDRPFSAESEGIYSEHFLDSYAAAKVEKGYDMDDEQGYVDRAVIEFKIPAKMESGAELMAEDYICFAIQINDIAEMTAEEVKAEYEKKPSNFPADFDPENPVFVEEEGVRSGYKHIYTRSRSQYPADGEMNGYAKAYLTEITPAQAAAELGE